MSDTVSLLELLHERFGEPAYVAGFSFGATLGALAAARRPDLVVTLVAVGMDIDGVSAGHGAYEFALTTARRARQAARHPPARAHRPAPAPEGQAVLDSGPLGQQLRWGHDQRDVRQHGTRALIASLLRSPDYSVADVIRILRGMTTTQAALLDRTSQHWIWSARCPVSACRSSWWRDARIRWRPAKRRSGISECLDAPAKELVWFENSAHTPHLEQPAMFRDLLIRVRAGQPASA